jgi:hypothetical protein
MSSSTTSNIKILLSAIKTQQDIIDSVKSVNELGELLVGDGTGPNYLNPNTGTDGQVLAKDSTANVGIKWTSDILATDLKTSTGTIAINGTDPTGPGQVLVIDAGLSTASWVNPAGSGDVLGPAANTTGYIPTWDGTNSKTLAGGLDPSTLATLTGAETLINKTLTSAATNDIAANSLHSATTVINVLTAAAPTTGQVLTASSGTAASWVTPSVSSGDTVAPATNTTGYIPTWNGTNSKTLTDGLDPTSLATLTGTETLTNKTLTSTTNTVNSKGLHSASTVVDVVTAAAPTAGQVLTASSGTAASWVTPAAEVGDTVAPAANTDNFIPLWDGTNSKTLKNGFATTDLASKTVTDFITVTGAVDLDAIEMRVNELDAVIVLAGEYDASVGTFPVSTFSGQSWIISVGGTIDSVAFNMNDRLVALVDGASTTVYAANWFKLDYTDQVLSVDGLTGMVDLSTSYEPKDTTILKDADIGVTVGDTLAPATNTTGYIPTWNGTNSKTLADGLDPSTLATLTGTETLTNKTLTSTTNTVNSKGLHSASTVVDVATAAEPTAGQVLTASSGTAAAWVTPTAGAGDTVAPAANTTGYIPTWNGTNSKTLADGLDPSTLVTLTGTETLINKTLTSAATNDIAANSLHSATTVINILTAAAPTTGQVLTASSGTAAAWVNPTIGDTIAPPTNTTGYIPTWNGTDSKTLADGLDPTTLVTLTGTETMTNKTLTTPIIDSISAVLSNVNLFQTLDTTTWASTDFGTIALSGDGLWLLGYSFSNFNVVAFTRATVNDVFAFSSIVSTTTEYYITENSLSYDGKYFVAASGGQLNRQFFVRSGTTWTLSTLAKKGTGGNISSDGNYHFVVDNLNPTQILAYSRGGSGDVWTQVGGNIITRVLGNNIEFPKSDATGNRLTVPGGTATNGLDIYVSSGVNTWAHEQQLTTIKPVMTVISDAGDLVIVYDATNGVQVFGRIGTTWTLDTTLIAPVYGVTAVDFGKYMDISKDGSTLAVHDSGVINAKTGRISIFARLSNSSWLLVKTIDDLTNDLGRRASSGVRLTAFFLSGDGTNMSLSSVSDQTNTYIYQGSRVLNLPLTKITGSLTASGLSYPVSDGSVGQLLNTDGAGNLSFVTPQVTLTGTETLTNKTLTDTTNNVNSKGLHSASTVVDVATAVAPTTGQVLTASSGTAAAWVTPAAGFADPMTTRGDVIVRNAANTTARLGIGLTGKVLTSDGTDITWEDPSGISLTNPSVGSYFVGSVATGTPGVNNLAYGGNALNAITTGTNNIAFGDTALQSITTQSDNIAIGQDTLPILTSGSENIAIGRNALKVQTVATGNIAMGANALSKNQTGGANVALGSSAMFNSTSGLCNVAIGLQALVNASGVSNNTAIGCSSGSSITSGAENTCIGSASDVAATLSNQMALGYQAIATQANQCMIGNNLLAEIVPKSTATCNLGSATNTFEDLHLAGDINIVGNINGQVASTAPLLSLAVGNAADTYDTGIYGKYVSDATGLDTYSGLHRSGFNSVPDAPEIAGKWILYDKVEAVPTADNVALTKVDNLVVNTVTAGTNMVNLGYEGAVYSSNQDRIYYIPFSQSNQTTWHYLDCTDGIVYNYTVTALAAAAVVGGVYDPDQHRIYLAPGNSSASDWQYIDCSNANQTSGTATIVNYAHAGVGSGAIPYRYGAYSPNEKRIYWCPNTSVTTWHYIDTTQSTPTFVAYNAGAGHVSNDYRHNVYCPNQDRIYFVPSGRSDVSTWHYIDCTDGTVNNVKSYSHGVGALVNNGYWGGVYSPTDERIYMAPYDIATQTTWHYIDCSNASQTSGTAVVTPYTHGLGALSTAYMTEMLYAPDRNEIYMPTRLVSTTWYVIDIVDSGVSPSFVGFTNGIATQRTYGGAYSPNQNKIYLAPREGSNEANWHFIDTKVPEAGDLIVGDLSTYKLTVGDITESTSVTTGSMLVSGGAGITKNLNVGGTIASTNPLLSLAVGNAADTYDTGIYGKYVSDATGLDTYSGLHRVGVSSTPELPEIAGKWVLYDGVTVTPTDTDISMSSVNNPIFGSYPNTFGGNMAPSAAYAFSVYCPTQDRIYHTPYEQSDLDLWHYTDCVDGLLHEYPTGIGDGTLPGTFYSGGVYDPDQQRIYLTPNNATATDWHYIDCSNAAQEADTAVVTSYTHAGVTSVSIGYTNGVYSPNEQRIYWCPQAQVTTWHYIDTTQSTPTFGAYNAPAGHTANDYSDAVYAPSQDRIYFIPSGGSDKANWNYIDCTDGTATNVKLYAHGLGAIVNGAYRGGVYSPTDDRIYMGPNGIAEDATWHYIDCSTASQGAGTAVVTGFATGSPAGIDNSFGWASSMAHDPDRDRVYIILQNGGQATWFYFDIANSGVTPSLIGFAVTNSKQSFGATYSATQKKLYITPRAESQLSPWYFIDTSAAEAADLIVGDLETHLLSVTDETQSLSTTTGAVTVAGGIGIIGNVNIGGTINGLDTTTLVTLTGTETLTDKTLTTPIIDEIDGIDTIALSQNLDTTGFGTNYGLSSISGDGLHMIGHDQAGTGNLSYFVRANTSAPFVFSSVIASNGFYLNNSAMSYDGTYVTSQNVGNPRVFYTRTGTIWSTQTLATDVGANSFTMSSDGNFTFGLSPGDGVSVLCYTRGGTGTFTYEGIVFTLAAGAAGNPPPVIESDFDATRLIVRNGTVGVGVNIFLKGAGSTWANEQRLTTVAALETAISDDGALAVVSDTTNGVQVFSRVVTTWTLETVIAAPTYAVPVSVFGEHIELSRDGNTLAIYDAATVNAKKGRVTIYKRVTNSNWTLFTTIDDIADLLGERNSSGLFLKSFSLSGDGSTFAISANGDPTNTTVYSIGSTLTITNTIVNISGTLTATGLSYPAADGTANQVITTDGAGTLSFVNSGRTPNTISVEKSGGDFDSIVSAINSISDNSITNSYIINVGPGEFTESAIIMKEYVSILGSGTGISSIIAASSTQTIITGVRNSSIRHITLKNASGIGGKGIFMTDSDLITINPIFRTQRIIIENCETCIHVLGSVNLSNRCSVILTNETFSAPYKYGLRIDGIVGIAIGILGLASFTPDATLIDAIRIDGVGGALVASSVTLVGKGFGNGILLTNGAKCGILSSKLDNFQTAINIENSGSSSQINATNIVTQLNTVDILIDQPTSFGAISGIFETSKISINSTNIILQILDSHRNGLTINGSLNVGHTFETVVDIVPLIIRSNDLGILTGGELANTIDLEIDVSSGFGYVESLSHDALIEIEWVDQTITVPSGTISYLYFDKDSTLKYSVSRPDNNININLGRVSTTGNAALFEITSVTTVADSGDSLNGTYFLIYSSGVYYYVWFNTGAGIDPGLSLKTGIEVALTTNDSDTTVATKLQTVINAHTDFSAPAPVGTVVTITNAISGNVPDATAGDSGFTISITTQGDGEIEFIDKNKMVAAHHGNFSNELFREVYGNLYASGSTVTGNASRELTITPGIFYSESIRYVPSGLSSGGTFYQYNYVSSVFSFAAQTVVNNTQYDDLTDLVSLTSTYYIKHSLYLVGDGLDERYMLVIGQEEHATLEEAQSGPKPIPPVSFSEGVTIISTLIMQQGTTTIIEIADERPRPSNAVSSSSINNNHGTLTGLANDDHPQYLLTDGTRLLSGSMDYNSNDIINIGNINNVDITSHASRHGANGAADALGTAAPLINIGSGTSNSTGTANTYSRSDHQHGLDSSVITTTGVQVMTNKTFSDSTAITAVTSSANIGTGALVVSGGIGVAENINAGGTLTASGLSYPVADGTANQVISTDGAGTLSFVSSSAPTVTSVTSATVENYFQDPTAYTIPSMTVAAAAGTYVCDFNAQYELIPFNNIVSTAATDIQIIYDNLVALTYTVVAAPISDGYGPGNYAFPAAAAMGTTITLTGTATDLFVFKINGALSTSATSTIVLAGGAISANVFFITTASGAIALTSGAQLYGTMIAALACSSSHGTANLEGRLLSVGAAITTTTSTVTVPPATSQIDMLSIESFALFTKTGAVTGTGANIINGDLGSAAGAITGYGTSTINGIIYNSDDTSGCFEIGFYQDGVLIAITDRFIETINDTVNQCVLLHHYLTLGSAATIDVRIISRGGRAVISNREMTMVKYS